MKGRGIIYLTTDNHFAAFSIASNPGQRSLRSAVQVSAYVSSVAPQRSQITFPANAASMDSRLRSSGFKMCLAIRVIFSFSSVFAGVSWPSSFVPALCSSTQRPRFCVISLVAVPFFFLLKSRLSAEPSWRKQYCFVAHRSNSSINFTALTSGRSNAFRLRRESSPLVCVRCDASHRHRSGGTRTHLHSDRDVWGLLDDKRHECRA